MLTLARGRVHRARLRRWSVKVETIVEPIGGKKGLGLVRANEGIKKVLLTVTAWGIVAGGLETRRASAQLREAHPLLTAIPDEKVPRLPVPDRAALRRRFAHADPRDLLLPPRDGARRPRPQRVLRLELFDGVAVEARVLSVEARGESSYTWFGRVPGEDVGDVILTVVDGVMMGTIHLGTRTFHLRALEQHLFELFEVDVTTFGQQDEIDVVSGDVNDLEAADALEPHSPRLIRRTAALARRNFRKRKRPLTYEEVGPDEIRMITDSGGRIDLFIAYTREAANAASSLVDFDGEVIPTATDIHTAIQHVVDQANFVLGLSGVPTSLHLVHTALVKDPEPATDSHTMLDYMEHGDGKFDELLALGDQYHADITSLFVSDFTDAFCGRGRVLPDLVEPEDQSYTSQGRGQRSAFGKNVVVLRCGVLNDTFVHELGHNAGLRHDHYVNDPANSPAVPGGHGFVLVPPRARTVMAYDDLCTDFFPEEIPSEPPIAVCKRLPRFSDPMASYQGWPMGLTGSAFVKPVNAVDALIAALWTVANFRHSLIGP